MLLTQVAHTFSFNENPFPVRMGRYIHETFSKEIWLWLLLSIAYLSCHWRWQQWRVRATSASLSIVSSPCLQTSAVRVDQRTIKCVSCGQLYAHCPSTLPCCVTLAVQSLVSTRLDYCNSLVYGIADGLMQRLVGFKRSRTPLHVWSPALDGATTYRLFSGSCTGFQFTNEFSSSWLC